MGFRDNYEATDWMESESETMEGLKNKYRARDQTRHMKYVHGNKFLT